MSSKYKYKIKISSVNHYIMCVIKILATYQKERKSTQTDMTDSTLTHMGLICVIWLLLEE